MNVSREIVPHSTVRRCATIGGMVTRHLWIEGLVQGVGYRASMCEQARRLGLTGWVRNRTGGGVEALARGPVDALERLEAWARRGPPAARVSSVRVSEVPNEPGQRFERFEQRPTA